MEKILPGKDFDQSCRPSFREMQRTLPEAVVTAFEQAWQISRADSPEYFTLYQGKGSVGGEKK